jgi:hypothetical protein
MSWPRDAVVAFNECSRESERENPNAGNVMNGPAPKAFRRVCDRCHRCQHQLMITRGSVDPELPGAFEEDAVDLTYGRPD